MGRAEIPSSPVGFMLREPLKQLTMLRGEGKGGEGGET